MSKARVQSARNPTMPALPNVFPYNEMLFQGILKLNGRGVKTRSWSWGYRGLILFYTSLCRYHRIPAEAYGLNPTDFPRGAIVGVGNLVNVRKLTKREKFRLLLQFNNATPKEAEEFGQFTGPAYVGPFDIGFFFKGLKRFKRPVPFTPKKGAIRTFRVPISVVAKALKEVGFDPKGLVS
jgi:hypothetical protein